MHAARVGVFPGEGFREMDGSPAAREVLLVGLFTFGEMVFACGFECPRQGHDAVFGPFAIVDGDRALAEIRRVS